MMDYEKLGAFYLGKTYDLTLGRLAQDLILYDAKDLCTHAMIIGMTGSGKTGLGIGLLEEALIDGIPVIAIDPKGDLTNLALQFPELRPEDFRPWINPAETLPQGMTADEFAVQQAALWSQGLAEWHQSKERIARLKAAAQLTVYTPGSTAGRPISLLHGFSPPPAALKEDQDLFAERIQTTAASLLSLLGIEADPVTSREHILIANILESVWRAGRPMDLPGLIHAVQTPPFTRIGVMDLNVFYPAKERLELALRINNLLAAPGFSTWMQGDALDAGSLFYTQEGRPRAAIVTISHLSEAQRMFFVSMLFNEILAWVRTQPGTTSLRAIVYMDEVFGYLPPVKNPPSKAPLLTLLKQARAFGLAVVLSTQNPVDLDYKGLSNTGTWFIGRLQTEQDLARVLTGLEGLKAGSGYDRSQLSALIPALNKRVFLLHNVHETRPVVFQTRWTLSYLSGPLSREQIKRLNPPLTETAPSAAKTVSDMSISTADVSAYPPTLPPGIDSSYLAASAGGPGVIYRPALLGRLNVRYFHQKHNIDTRKIFSLAAEMADDPLAVDWDRAETIDLDPQDLVREPQKEGRFAPLPAVALKSSSYRKWQNDLLRWVRQNRPLTLFQSPKVKLISRPDETQGQFRTRLGQALRENRDLAVEKLKLHYRPRFTTLNDRLMRAEQAVMREQEQAKTSKVETAISFGTAILGAFLGRKAISATSASRMGTALKSAGRIQKESMDVARAEESVNSIRQQLSELQAQFQKELESLETHVDPNAEQLEEIRVLPKENDIGLEFLSLVWMPWHKDPDGRLTADWKESMAPVEIKPV
jgi:hypothetical protein